MAAWLGPTGWWRAVPEAALLEPLHRARSDAALGGRPGARRSCCWPSWRLLRPLAQLEQRAQHLFDAAQALHEGGLRPAARSAASRACCATWPPSGRSSNLQRPGDAQAVVGDGGGAGGHLLHARQALLLVSAEFCRLFGRSEAEMLGQPASSIYASNEDHQAIGPQVLAAFREGKPYQGEW